MAWTPACDVWYIPYHRIWMESPRVKSELPRSPKYRSTMDRLEKLRQVSSSGTEYWFARDIQGTLGYREWRNFERVIDRARSSMLANEVPPSHHIVQTTRMMIIGNDGRRRERDYFLSRAACYLIAMNGEPSKHEIAAAQAYFAVQTREREVEGVPTEDEKRLDLREKIKESFKKVSKTASKAGVRNEKQPVFHDARYRGLYGMSARDMKNRKGIRQKDNPFDYMGALELSANDFQMNLAAETIQKESIRGEDRAIQKNRQIAERVRRTMVESGSRPPEELPAAEPIKIVAKRLKENKVVDNDPDS